MKIRIFAIISALAVMLMCAGCSMFASEYVYSEPYSAGEQPDGAGAGAEIKTYYQLREALQSAVSSAKDGLTLRFSGYTGSVSDDMAAACYEVRTSYPMGAYAVESVDYKLDRIVSYYTADVTFTYKRTAEEINAVVTLNGLTELNNYIKHTLSVFGTETALKVYSSAVDTDYIADAVEEACFSYPELLPVQPRAQVRSYPEEGYSRIYDLRLDYGADADALREMRDAVTAELDAVCPTFTASAEGETLLHAVTYLSARCTQEGEQPTAKTAYAALVTGAADSQGAALALKAVCDRLGIDCTVVRGTLGTLGAQAHYWNIVRLGGDYYHVDASRYAEVGASGAFLKSDAELWGEYMWDSEKYPGCSGSLTWRSFVPDPAAQQTEETDAPAPTDAPETPAPDGESENLSFSVKTP